MRKWFVKSMSILLALVSVLVPSFSALAGEYVDITGIDPLTGETYYTSVYVPDAVEKPSVISIGQDYVKLEFYSAFLDENGGYEISLYQDGVYTPVQTVAEQYEYVYQVEIKGLARGTTYNFAVRAYNTWGGVNYYGPYSELLCATTAPAAVTLSKVSYTAKGKMKVKWKKRKGVDGYVVQYSTSKKFPQNGKTVSVTVRNEKTLSKVIGGLAAKTYYVRVCGYKQIDGVRYCGTWSKTKSVKIKMGLSMKQMLNAVKTNNNGRKTIKSLTNNKVDIAKYKTTYDKVKAIYNWHAKNYNKFAHCLACNSNFNSCLYALYDSKETAPDIWIAAGEVKNSDGSQVIHKWSVLYIAGVEYIFDPRLQGYTGNYTGNLYFGVSKGSRTAKMYVFDGWYGHWTKDSKNVYSR